MGETGAGAPGARAGSVAETQGSGSKTGEAVKDLERPVDRKPGREGEHCVERRALEASATPPSSLTLPNPPTSVGGKPSIRRWVPRLLDLRAEVPEFYILQKGRNHVLSH